MRIASDHIVAIGALTPRRGETIVDAHGLVLAPGFIDTHSHHERSLMEKRDAPAVVSQGVTTIVAGQDGGGINLAARFARIDNNHQPSTSPRTPATAPFATRCWAPTSGARPPPPKSRT